MEAPSANIDLTDERLGAYVDGELDPATHASVERALAADPDARKRVATLRDVTQLVRAAVHSEAGPALPRAVGRPATGARGTHQLPALGSRKAWRLAAAFAGAALALAFAAQIYTTRVERGPGWQDNSLALHTTYLRARADGYEHVLMDVTDPRSDDSAQTYASFVDYAPVFPDLSAHSYEPAGVRFVPSPYGMTTFVAYEAPGLSPIGFSMTPATAAFDSRSASHSSGAVQLLSWSDGEFEYGLSSELSHEALAPLMRTAQTSLGATPGH
jgi:anti-sigma factor RsiW